MDWTLFFTVIASILLLDVFIRFVVIWASLPIVERKIALPESNIIPDPIAEQITFPTTDGLELQGSLYQHTEQPARGIILFCPEMGANHWSAMSYAQGAWNAGFDILSFDFRGQGESPDMENYDPLHWVTEYELADANAAIDYIKKRKDLSELPLSLMGVSRGGGAALLTAAQNPEVLGVLAEGAFTNQELMVQFGYSFARKYFPEFLVKLFPYWHIQITLNLVYWISQVRRNCKYAQFRKTLPLLQSRPVHLITGTRDTQVPSEVAVTIARIIGGTESSIWNVRDAKHNGARQKNPTRYDNQVSQFFSNLVPEQVESTPLPSFTPATVAPPYKRATG